MSDVLIRDVGDAVLSGLKERAKRQHRSLQAELKLILSEAVGRHETMSEIELIRKIRAGNTKTNKTNSVDLLREDRAR